MKLCCWKTIALISASLMMSACGKGQVNPKETQRTFGSARSDLENAPRKSTDAAAVTTGDSDSGASSQSSWECLVFQTNCEKLPKLFRCARGGLAGTYSGPMYVKNATQCSDAQMEMEPAPLFLGLPGLDRDIVAWSRAGQGGTKYYRYEKSGDNPGSGFQREGIAFSVSSREFTHPKKVVLYSCEVDCTQLATNAQCEAGMSFIALERECEGKGTPKGLLGYAIAP